MTDLERAENHVKNEVCIKLCPVWTLNGKKCDLFPKCHHVNSDIISYYLGLIEGRKEATTFEGMALKKAIISIERENEQLKTRNHIVPEHYLSEAIDKCNELEAQIEKMKCCGNCSNYYLGEDRFYRCKAGSFFMSCNGKNCKDWRSL